MIARNRLLDRSGFLQLSHCSASHRRESSAAANPVYQEFPVLVVAIDIGGTFTDLIGFDEAKRKFVQAKSLTTPAELVQGIIDCLRKSGIDAAEVDELIHGS